MASRWWTPRAVSAHVALALSEPGFGALCWWQLHRALSGNHLSWMYAFEWPFFGFYAAVLWWRIVHTQAGFDERGANGRSSATGRAGVTWHGRLSRRSGGGRHAGDARQADEDRRLAAYNRYLAALGEHERSRNA